MADISNNDRIGEARKSLSSDQMLPLVYEELRKLASVYLANERPGQTLQPTALVHEAYVRLASGSQSVRWSNRRHFLGAAAVAIRRILIENARRKARQKRGGGLVREDLNGVDPVVAAESLEDLLALDDALQKLDELDSQAAELVQLLYFAGLTLPEAAEVLEVSVRTVSRKWTFARAWLRNEIDGGDMGEQNF